MSRRLGWCSETFSKKALLTSSLCAALPSLRPLDSSLSIFGPPCTRGEEPAMSLRTAHWLSLGAVACALLAPGKALAQGDPAGAQPPSGPPAPPAGQAPPAAPAPPAPPAVTPIPGPHSAVDSFVAVRRGGSHPAGIGEGRAAARAAGRRGEARRALRLRRLHVAQRREPPAQGGARHAVFHAGVPRRRELHRLAEQPDRQHGRRLDGALAQQRVHARVPRLRRRLPLRARARRA